MPTRTIEKDQWKSYFDEISRELTTTKIDLEITGSDMGAQIETRQMPLTGLSYDHRDDAFSFVAETLEHRVSHPQRISVEEEVGELRAIEVIDSDDHKHVARLTEALRLPQPRGSAGA